MVLLVLVAKKDVTGVESNVIYTVERVVLDNSNLYEDMEKVPYSITQYAPLGYMISDALLSVTHIPTESNSNWVRIVLRLESFAFFLLLLLFGIKLIELVKGETMSKNVKMLFILLVTAFTAPWYFLVRPDVLVTLFYVCGTYYLLLGLKNKRNIYLSIAGFVSLLAFLSKQNGILIILVTVVFLLIKVKFKPLIYYLIGVIFSALFFSITYLVAGYPLEYISDNLIIGVANGIDIYSAINNAIIPFISIFGFPFLLILLESFHKRKEIQVDTTLQYISFFAVSSLGFAALTCLKLGSAVNYFNDFMVFSIIVIFALEKVISKQAIIICLIFCISLTCYHIFKYGPRSLYFTLLRNHYDELEYGKSVLNKYDSGKYFYTNIRNLILDSPNSCIFPQYEIVTTAINQKNAAQYYKNIMANIDYDKLELIIIDTKMGYINFDFSHFKLIDKYKDIEVYKN